MDVPTGSRKYRAPAIWIEVWIIALLGILSANSLILDGMERSGGFGNGCKIRSALFMGSYVAWPQNVHLGGPGTPFRCPWRAFYRPWGSLGALWVPLGRLLGKLSTLGALPGEKLGNLGTIWRPESHHGAPKAPRIANFGVQACFLSGFGLQS